AIGTNQFGSAQSTVVVKRPLVVRSSLPRFLAPGDRCEMPVQVFTESGHAGDANVTVAGRGVSVRPPQDHVRDWEVTAEGPPGVATVTLNATLGAERYTEQFELAVRPAAARATVCGSGMVAPGVSILIKPATNWWPGTAEQELWCSGLPGLKLSGGLD